MVTLNELGAAALTLVVAAIAIGIGATIQTDLAESNQCVGTWFDANPTGNTTNASALMRVNPIDDSWSGCCTTLNTSYPQAAATGGYCQVWYTSSIALNATYKGIEANETLGSWLPIIAIVVAAVVVIGLLVVYLGGLGGRM